jgi:ribonuclease HII
MIGCNHPTLPSPQAGRESVRDLPKPDFSFEQAAMERGHAFVCGIDEAGRGPWAGPVVAAAVILDPRQIPGGMNDSKKLTHQKREELFAPICAASQFGIGIVDAATIDEINILQATYLAMQRALSALKNPPQLALVDGNRAPKFLCPVQTIVGGDGKSLSIAAASILAKVTRDRMMVELDKEFPNYGFAAHKGYGTPMHQAALTKFGPVAIHRKSFKPVAAALTR